MQLWFDSVFKVGFTHSGMQKLIASISENHLFYLKNQNLYSAGFSGVSDVLLKYL